MAIDSMSFIYVFLPAAILLFAITPARGRSFTLLVISGIFYYLIEGQYILLMAGVLLFDYLMVCLLHRSAGMVRLRRAIVFCSVGKSVALFAYYSIMQQLGILHFPLGLGVYALTSMGYVLDCYHNLASFERNPVPVLLASAFFPKLYAGPLVQYARLGPQLRSLKLTWAQIGEGGGLFLCGVAKKLMLGDPIRVLLESLHAIPIYQVTTLTAWVMVGTLALTLYLLLSGYCDIARGLGILFGFDIPENFFYPCRARGVNEFLARFNATISRYMRRNVYVALGGSHGGALSAGFNILLVSILMGMWFGVRLNFVAWGLCLGVFVIIEKYLFPKGWQSAAPLFRWSYCMAAVSVSFAFFLGDSLQSSVRYLAIMLGLSGTGGFNNGILYLLASNNVILIVALVVASGLPHSAAQRVKRRLPALYTCMCGAGSILLLVGITAFLM